MASCAKCNIGVGCDCNLTNGLCRNCYREEPKYVAPLEKKPCTQTMQQLLNLRAMLISRQRTSLTTYHISILNSQIAQFVTNPCKFENIIKNIS